MHRLAINPATWSKRLTAHEDVFGHRKIGKECGLLIDDSDASVLGFGCRFEVNRLSMQDELASITLIEARNDFDERRLAGAILTNKSVDGTGLHAQASRLESDDRAKGLAHVAQNQSRCRFGGVHQVKKPRCNDFSKSI